MSHDVTCKNCGTSTCECPDNFPPEWQGYCPSCAVGKMFAGELPKCDMDALLHLTMMKLIDTGLIEIEVVEDHSEMEMAFTGTGQIMRYHPADQCEGHFCPMHNPSDHHMRDWPMHGRSDLKFPIIERLCPHNALHPDPDSLAWALRQDSEFEWYHGACDGCCRTT